MTAAVNRSLAQKMLEAGPGRRRVNAEPGAVNAEERTPSPRFRLLVPYRPVVAQRTVWSKIGYNDHRSKHLFGLDNREV
jgi:hypothetical protein